MGTRALVFSFFFVVATHVAACAKGEPASPTPPAADAIAVSARAPDPAPPRADARDAAAPDAAAPDAAPLAAPLDARCVGATIDLVAILLEEACVDGSSPLESAPSLRATASAPQRLAPGAEGVATVIYSNGGTSDVDLHVQIPTFGRDGLGTGWDPRGVVKPKPPPPRAVPAHASTKSADGTRSFDATWVMFGAASHRYAHVRIAPSGTATLRMTVLARGFLPGKASDSSTVNIDSPPDPLPPGRYKVTLWTGVATGGVTAPVIDLDVGR